MSTLVLIDPGAGSKEPLRLENDVNDFGFRFLVNDDGDLRIEDVDVSSLTLAGNHQILLNRTSLGTSEFPAIARVLVTQVQNQTYLLQMRNADPTNPRGLRIDFDGQTTGEDNTAIDNYFFFLNASVTIPTKAYISSDGGFHNRQANDTDISDENLKVIEDEPVGSMWAEAKALRIINYRDLSLPDTRMLIGLGAQQVKTVMPECVKDATELVIPAKEAYDEVDEDTGARRRIGARPEERIPIPAEYYSKDVAFCFYRTVQECMERIEALEA